mmetsp:Transcript_18021/g.49056  ORF Transcript_18021/g.49056 Transcript_18021/m.49056 type:complete len:396 (-) Transcript_18021:148-1335(-)
MTTMTNTTTNHRRRHPKCDGWFLVVAVVALPVFLVGFLVGRQSKNPSTSSPFLLRSKTPFPTTTTTRIRQRDEINRIATELFLSTPHNGNNNNPSEIVEKTVPPSLRVWKLLQGSPPAWMCLAPKTGCTAWFFFLLHVNNGITVPAELSEQHPALIHTTYSNQTATWSVTNLLDRATKTAQNNNNSTTTATTTATAREQVLQLFRNSTHFVIARNPYVRFVSSWKDWKYRTQRDNTSFAEFVQLYKTNQIDGKRSPMDHIWPVSRYCRLVVGGRQNPILRYTVLRVEQQALWFDAFLEHHGLTRSYADYTARGGRLFSPQVHDGDPVGQHLRSAVGREPWPGGVLESSHHRGSSSQVKRYYNRSLALEVTELAKDDFVNFQYPIWDGRPETFRYV